MKRFTTACALLVVLGAALPAGAQGATDEALPNPFALAGEARGLELAITDQGVTLGVAVSEADSTPQAAGLGAGQCEILGDAGTTEAPCTAATAETSEYPGEEGDDQETCGAPSLPAPLDSLLAIRSACGFSQSGLEEPFAVTANRGQVTQISLEFDVSGLSTELEAAKDQVVDGLKDVLTDAPDPIRPALNALLDALDQGEAGRIRVGRAESNIASVDGAVEVTSTAGGAEIGLIGIPDLDAQGQPIPQSANALEDGLIIIEVGDALSSASLDAQSLEADAAAEAALVKVFVRDITQYPDTVYEEVELPVPGQSVTILPDTPLESTITAASADTEVTDTTALAASDAVTLHLLKGAEFEGGIQLGLARTTAAASFEAQEVEPSPSVAPTTREPLPATGGKDRAAWGLILLALAGAFFFLRRRLHP